MNKKQLQLIIRDLETTADRLVIERDATPVKSDANRQLTDMIGNLLGNVAELRAIAS